MKEVYILIGLIALIALATVAWYKLRNTNAQQSLNSTRPTHTDIPSNEKSNDKLVLIEEVNDQEINKIVQDFCNMYNKNDFIALPRVTNLSEKKFAITFPYDIDFETFCYFINYVRYPTGFERSFKTRAWTTTKSSDKWITEKSANKKVMIFLSEFDDEYDNVFMTTADNIGYKLGFAVNEQRELLNGPEKLYEDAPFNLHDFHHKVSTDFK